MSITAEKIRPELAGMDEDAEAAWDAELARRGEEIRSGRAIGEPAGKIFAELRAKHS